MCVILIGLAADILELDLDMAWYMNSDGAGVIVRDDRKSFAIKGLMTLKGLEAVLTRYSDRHVVAHLRLATHGTVNKANTHPFPIGDGHLVHNGIASHFGTAGTCDKSESDSCHLARVIAKLDHRDRVAVLNSVGGKYAWVLDNGKCWTVGEFEKTVCGKVQASNTYWERGYYPTWAGGRKIGDTYAIGDSYSEDYLDNEEAEVQAHIEREMTEAERDQGIPRYSRFLNGKGRGWRNLIGAQSRRRGSFVD